ncbi:MAG: hypothetical protein LUF85_00345 [Bacteroides sp.]|nr:hypothetical protein [Bacteroides sp.]
MKTTHSPLPTFLLCAAFLLCTWCSCSSSDDPTPEPTPPDTEEPAPDPKPAPDPDPDKQPPAPWPYARLTGLWNHLTGLDATAVATALDVNMIWTNDPEYNGQMTWEQSHMYKSLQIPGVDYVFGKINRVAWGWTHQGSLEHARWVAGLSLEHPEIIGLYLNDFYDEIEEGYRTEDQWREIIAATRSVNPDLDL